MKYAIALVMLAFVSATFAQAAKPEEKKMVVYLAFDEGQGEQLKNGVEGETCKCNIENKMRAVTWDAGKKGKALHFQTQGKDVRGQAGAVSISNFNTQQFKGGITVAFWMKMDDNADWQRRTYQLASFAPGDLGPGFVLSYNWRQLEFWTGPGTDRKSCGSVKYVFKASPCGKWIHVCISSDAQKGTVIYLDGKECARDAAARYVAHDAPKRARSTMSIGSGWCGARNGFPGILDEVKIYNYAIPAEEVAKAMNE